MFRNFNFAISNLMMFMLGILLFSSLVLMPLFLQTLVGYTSQVAGLALSAGGLVLLFEQPIVGQLTTKVHARRLIAFGWLALSVAMYYSTQRIDLQISFGTATLLRVVQVIGLGFLFVPISLVAYIGIAPEKNNSVAGLINFMRNIGSSVGTSMVTTLLARRSQLHQNRLVEFTQSRTISTSRIQSTGLTQQFAASGMSAHEARAASAAAIYQALLAQAETLSYIDIFMVLSVASGDHGFAVLCLEKERSRRRSGTSPSDRIKDAMVTIVTIEREYGSGGGDIAQLLATQLGWKLWDQQLTEEIARIANCSKEVVEHREERTDPLYYRLFKSFLRGSYEGSMNAQKLNLVDSETILKMTQKVVEHAAKKGHSRHCGKRVAAFSSRPARRASRVSVCGSGKQGRAADG